MITLEVRWRSTISWRSTRVHAIYIESYYLAYISLYMKLAQCPRLKKMVVNFKALPLKCLATNKVIEANMDYKDFLTGPIKEELDGLNRLEGKYFVYHRTDLKVRRYGKTKDESKLSKEELESLIRMTHLNARIPRIFFLNGKKEFNIVERFKSGKRGWDLHDLDGHSKEIRLSSRLGCVKAGNSIYREDWIKEGNLVMTTTHLDPMGKLFLGEVDVFTIYNKDIVRTVIWTLPALKIKIMRELWAQREGGTPCKQCINSLGCRGHELDID